jgi:hypothetical protein
MCPCAHMNDTHLSQGWLIDQKNYPSMTTCESLLQVQKQGKMFSLELNIMTNVKCQMV